MSNGEIRPTTVIGLKRLATQIKRDRGIKYHVALQYAAHLADCQNFRHASKILPQGGSRANKNAVFLTGYWRSADGRAIGRETLKVVLFRPLLEICPKKNFKYVRGFSDMRLVSVDHFVCDLLSEKQEDVRMALCKAARSLTFMEYTGLRPFRPNGRDGLTLFPSAKLPGTDHATDWEDPATGQLIVIDEPYGGRPDEEAREAWARKNGCRISKTVWPGMYFPNECDLYVVTRDNRAFNFDGLVAKINAMLAPVVPSAVDWLSATTFDAFISPETRTAQDRRRARSRGTIMPMPSASTIPYRMALGVRHRRPARSMAISDHIIAGRIIVSVLETLPRYSRSYRLLDNVRSKLESWLGSEIPRGKLEGREFFDVYFPIEEIKDSFSTAPQTTDDSIEILGKLRQMLISAYPDCGPLRAEIKRIDLATAIIKQQPKNPKR